MYLRKKKKNPTVPEMMQAKFPLNSDRLRTDCGIW